MWEEAEEEVSEKVGDAGSPSGPAGSEVEEESASSMMVSWSIGGDARGGLPSMRVLAESNSEVQKE